MLKPELSSKTVNPPELAFQATSDVQCAAVSGFTTEPSDHALAVGDILASVLQGVNTCINLYNKSGVQQAGFPKSANAFFALGALSNADPRMLFDWINHRFLYVIISYPNSCTTPAGCTSPAFYNLAVSRTNDTAGSWCMYQLAVATLPNPNAGGVFFLPDYPRLGQDRDTIYLAGNLFQPNYVSEEIIALKKTDLYACSNAVPRTNFTGFGDLTGQGQTIQPATLFSPYDDPKSMLFVTSHFGTRNKLVVSAIHDPFGTPTFTRVIVTGTNTYWGYAAGDGNADSNQRYAHFRHAVLCGGKDLRCAYHQWRQWSAGHHHVHHYYRTRQQWHCNRWTDPRGGHSR